MKRAFAEYRFDCSPFVKMCFLQHNYHGVLLMPIAVSEFHCMLELFTVTKIVRRQTPSYLALYLRKQILIFVVEVSTKKGNGSHSSVTTRAIRLETHCI